MHSRWHGIDLIRLTAFVAVAIFHFTHWAWYAPGVPSGVGSLVWRWAEPYARALSFSGFTLCWIYAFLVGWKKPRLPQNIGTLGALLLAWWAFSAMNWLSEDDKRIFWVWDIYPLLIVSIASACWIGSRSLRSAQALGIFGILLVVGWLGVKGHEWSIWDGLPLVLRQAWVGECRNEDLADWPLLPWTGWIWAAYACGRWTSDPPARGLEIRRREALAWTGMLVFSVAWLFIQGSVFFGIRLGPHFACESFRTTALDFIAHLAWPLAAMRISIDPRVQSRLAALALSRGISALHLSQHFGLAYFVSYALTALAHALIPIQMARDEFTPAVLVLAVLPATELILRMSTPLASRIRSPSRSPILALLMILVIGYEGGLRWGALVCLSLMLALTRSTFGELALGALLGWSAWLTLPYLHPDWCAGLLVLASLATLPKSRTFRILGAGVTAIAAIGVIRVAWQEPGPQFAAYIRARPALLDSYHPIQHLPDASDPPGWVWREKSDGHFLLATEQGWISDGGRLIQNPTGRIVQAVLESAGQSGISQPRVRLHALLTPELCNELREHLESGRVIARQPVPFGRTPACETVLRPGVEANPATTEIEVRISPFESHSVGEPETGTAKLRWICARRNFMGLPMGLGQIHFRWLSCAIEGDPRLRKRVLESKAIRMNLAIFGEDRKDPR